MTWALNANGFTGDIKMVEQLIEDIAAVLAKPEYGTGSSMMSGPSIMKTNFHVRETTEDTPAEGVSPGPALPGETPDGAIPSTDQAPPPASVTPEGNG